MSSSRLREEPLPVASATVPTASPTVPILRADENVLRAAGEDIAATLPDADDPWDAAFIDVLAVSLFKR